MAAPESTRNLTGAVPMRPGTFRIGVSVTLEEVNDTFIFVGARCRCSPMTLLAPWSLKDKSVVGDHIAHIYNMDQQYDIGDIYEAAGC